MTKQEAQFTSVTVALQFFICPPPQRSSNLRSRRSKQAPSSFHYREEDNLQKAKSQKHAIKMQSVTRSPVFSSHLASAIYLNNIGVSLMERCCYQEALETFQNAVDICRIKPSQAMLEHTVYRAYLRLSSITDNCYNEGDNQKCSYSVRAIPIVYDQFGNNISVSLPSKENRRRSAYSAVSRPGRSKNDERQIEYSLVYFQTNQRNRPTEISSLLSTTLYANCRQAKLLVERRSSNRPFNVYDLHFTMVTPIFPTLNHGFR